MKLLGKSKIIVQKSKFFGYLYELDSIIEAEKAIEEVSLENFKANHICYGLFLKKEENFKNDREVGNPGKMLLEILKQKSMNSHILLVARHFGGIKLGPAGVGKAFRRSGELAIQN